MFSIEYQRYFRKTRELDWEQQAHGVKPVTLFQCLSVLFFVVVDFVFNFVFFFFWCGIALAWHKVRFAQVLSWHHDFQWLYWVP